MGQRFVLLAAEHAALAPLCRTAQAGSLLLAHAGVETCIAQCDTSVAADVLDLLGCRGAAAALPPVAGVVNSGGVLQDAVITSQTAARLRTAFAPKLGSALAMHGALQGLPVSQTLLFSSVAALLGSPGQANYAAANGALEGWVAAAAAQGAINGAAVQWGAWAVGEAAGGCNCCVLMSTHL